MRFPLMCCVLCLLACTGPLACSASFRSPRTGTPAATTPTHTQWMSFYLFGLIGGQDRDLRDVCARRGAARIRVGHSWLSALVTLGTLGIYAPRVVSVECGSP